MRLRPSELEVKRKLESEGWDVYHSGFPDFLCFKDRKVKFVEVKATGRLTMEQYNVLTALEAAGMETEIVKISKKDIGPRFSIDIPDELEARVREKVSKRFGLKLGALNKGLTEAISEWVAHD